MTTSSNDNNNQRDKKEIGVVQPQMPEEIVPDTAPEQVIPTLKREPDAPGVTGPETHVLSYVMFLNGMDILAYVDFTPEGDMVVIDPLKIMRMQTTSESGDIAFTIMLTAWIPFTNERIFDVNVDSVIVVCEAQPEIAQMYARVMEQILENRRLADISGRIRTEDNEGKSVFPDIAVRDHKGNVTSATTVQDGKQNQQQDEAKIIDLMNWSPGNNLKH